MRLGAIKISVGGPCNNNCRFCRRSGSPHLTVEEIYDIALRGKSLSVIIDCDSDVTIRKDFTDIVNALRRAGISKILLFTNGRMFCYRRMVRAVVDLGIDLIGVILLHASGEVHDEITGVKGSFSQTMAGIKNLISEGFENLYIVFVPTAKNVNAIDAIADICVANRCKGIIIYRKDEGVRIPRDVARIKRKITVTTCEELTHSFHIPATNRFSSVGATPLRFNPKEKVVSCVLRTSCKNSCIFCTTRIINESNRSRWVVDPVEFFYQDIIKYRQMGCRNFRFVAIEPLEHPHIEKFTRFIWKSGYDNVEIWTSARSLADRSFAKAMRKSGLKKIKVPIMGADSKFHDIVAGSVGAFDETTRGIENALSNSIKCEYHLIITKQNMGQLKQMASIGEKLSLGRFSYVIIPSPSLQEPEHYRLFMPEYTLLARVISELPRKIAEAYLNHGLIHQIPPCVIIRNLPLYASLLAKLKSGGENHTEIGDVAQPGAMEKLKAACQHRSRCKMADVCRGYHKQYAKIFSDGEFSPLN